MEAQSWLWWLVAFWIGTCAGFAASALMQISRKAEHRSRRPIPPPKRGRGRYDGGLSLDTVTRY